MAKQTRITNDHPLLRRLEVINTDVNKLKLMFGSCDGHIFIFYFFLYHKASRGLEVYFENINQLFPVISVWTDLLRDSKVSDRYQVIKLP